MAVTFACPTVLKLIFVKAGLQTFRYCCSRFLQPNALHVAQPTASNHWQKLTLWVWSDKSYYLLNTIQNSSPSNTGYPASNHTIHVITSPLCLPQLEAWRAHWWSLTARLYLSQMKASQMLTYTVTAYVMYSPQPSSHRSKNEFCTEQSPWSFTTWYLTTWKSAASVDPHHTCPVAFWSLSAFEQLQGPHHQRHIRCLSGVWSGTTLHRASVQLSKPSNATHSASPAAVADFLNLGNWR